MTPDGCVTTSVIDLCYTIVPFTTVYLVPSSWSSAITPTNWGHHVLDTKHMSFFKWTCSMPALENDFEHCRQR